MQKTTGPYNVNQAKVKFTYQATRLAVLSI